MLGIKKNDVLRILDETQEERIELQNHKIYSLISDIRNLKIFMEHHVFAVWDFMSILKSLQLKITCARIPWYPRGYGESARLINEIILAEETDETLYGGYSSHFEMYVHGMNQAGAETKVINNFLNEIQNNNLELSLENANVPPPSKKFIKSTFKLINQAPAHEIASIFTFGREEVIPEMFKAIVKKIDKKLKGELKPFIFYLDRHIGLDEDAHTPAALRMIKDLCGNSQENWDEALLVGKKAMKYRIQFWDEIALKLD
tara:strand:- start:243 stop:1019 length:777 start_codon:yes stop_codon:yes gene_type:complete